MSLAILVVMSKHSVVQGGNALSPFNTYMSLIWTQNETTDQRCYCKCRLQYNIEIESDEIQRNFLKSAVWLPCCSLCFEALGGQKY